VRRTTLHDQVATKLRAELGGDVREGVAVTPATLAKGIAVLLAPTLTREQFDLSLDGLKRVPGESSLGSFAAMDMTTRGNWSVIFDTPQHGFDHLVSFRRHISRWAGSVAQPINKQRNHTACVVAVIMRRQTQAPNRL
jgi:hypothetical protein